MLFKFLGISYFIKERAIIASYTIKIYECATCLTLFSSTKDLLDHKCQKCKKNGHLFVFNPEKTTKCLLELIAVNNYSFASIGSPAFQRFIDTFGRLYCIPSPDKIARLMIQYAQYIQNDVLNKLKGSVITLLIDGGTRSGRHFEGVLLWNNKGIHFYSLEGVPDFKTLTLAQRLAAILTILRERGIIVIAVCSDNASNNTALFNPSNINSLYNIFPDFNLIRVPCCCHVINLGVSDTIYVNIMFKSVYKAVKALIKFPPKNTKPRTPPKFTKVRWYSFFECVIFICDNKSLYSANDINILLVESVCGWDTLEAVSIKVIELIKLIEGDAVALFTVFPLISNFIREIEEIAETHEKTLGNDTHSIEYQGQNNNPIIQSPPEQENHPSSESRQSNEAQNQVSLPRILASNIRDRFFNTEGMEIPTLCYLLTSNGYNYIHVIRNTPLGQYVINFAIRGLQMYINTRRFEKGDIIIQGFIHFIETDFHYPEFACPSQWWSNIRSPEDYALFSKVALELVQLPATEAPVERVFAKVENMITAHRERLSNQMVNSLMIVKSKVLFKDMKYMQNNRIYNELKMISNKYTGLYNKPDTWAVPLHPRQ